MSEKSPLDMQIERFERAAAELELAVKHAKTSARHLREREMARAWAHGFALVGHLRKAQKVVDEIADDHAKHAVP